MKSENKMKSLDLDELLLYESCSFWLTKYAAWDWMRSLIGRYLAWKVGRKLDRYYKHKAVKEALRPCGVCGETVGTGFYWWTGNPNKPESLPLHDDCAKGCLFGDD